MSLGFSYTQTRDGSVFIAREGRRVTTLRGPSAQRFLAGAESADGEAQQQLMARVTGNYKRGNERWARSS